MRRFTLLTAFILQGLATLPAEDLTTFSGNNARDFIHTSDFWRDTFCLKDIEGRPSYINEKWVNLGQYIEVTQSQKGQTFTHWHTGAGKVGVEKNASLFSEFGEYVVETTQTALFKSEAKGPRLENSYSAPFNNWPVEFYDEGDRLPLEFGKEQCGNYFRIGNPYSSEINCKLAEKSVEIALGSSLGTNQYLIMCEVTNWGSQQAYYNELLLHQPKLKKTKDSSKDKVRVYLFLGRGIIA